VFVNDKPFLPSLMFVGKEGAYPRVEHFGRLLAFPTNIGQGSKGLSETNTKLILNIRKLR
jgi:hypothetical protein